MAAKTRKPAQTLLARVDKLEDELKQRDARIRELRNDLNKAEALIIEEREYIEDAMAMINAWKEAFGMVQDDKGVWQWDDWVDQRNQMVKQYEALARKWNEFVPEYNATVLKGTRNVGRPLGADAWQIEQVRKLRKAGKSLRVIATMMALGLPTVRTILDRDNGSDRMTKKRWQKLHPGEKWKDRSYTPVSALERVEIKQFREEPWRVRARASLPKRIGETLERGHELVKAAKGAST